MASGILDDLPGYGSPVDDGSDDEIRVQADAQLIKSGTESPLDDLPVISQDSLNPEQSDALYFQIARGGGESLRHVQSQIYNRKVGRGELKEINAASRFLKMMTAHGRAGLETLEAGYKEADRLAGTDLTDENLRQMRKHDDAAAAIMTDKATGGGTYGLPEWAVGFGGHLQSSIYTVSPIASALLDKGRIAEKSLSGQRFSNTEALSNTAKFLPFYAVSLHETAEQFREIGLDPVDHYYEVAGAAAWKMTTENAVEMLKFAGGAAIGTAGKAAIKSALGVSAVNAASRGVLKSLGYAVVRGAGTVGVGAVTEGSQNLSDMFAAHYALGKTEGMNDDEAIQGAWERSTTPKAMAGHFEAAKDALWMEAAGLFMGVPFGTMRSAARMKMAAKNAYAFKATADAISRFDGNSSGLADAQAKEAGLQVAKMGWNEFHSAIGDLDDSVSGKAEFVALGGDPNQYDAARDTGGELVMDAGKFVEKIGRAGLGEKVFKDVMFNEQDMTLREAETMRSEQSEELDRATRAVEAIDAVNSSVEAMKLADTNEAKIDALSKAYEDNKDNPEVAGMLLEAASDLANDLDDQEKALVSGIIGQYLGQEGKGAQIRASIASDESVAALAEGQSRVNAAELGLMVASGSMDQDTAGAAAIVRDRMLAGGYGEAEAHANGLIWGKWYKHAGEHYLDGGKASATDMAAAYSWEFETDDNLKALGLSNNANKLINMGHRSFDATKTGVKMWARMSAPGMGAVLAHESAHSFHYMLMDMKKNGLLSAQGIADLKTIDRAYNLEDRSSALIDAQNMLRIAQAALGDANVAYNETLTELGREDAETKSAARSIAREEANVAKAEASEATARKAYSDTMERFAVHAEKYFETEEAPSKQLAGPFSRLKKWAKKLVSYHVENFGVSYDKPGKYSTDDMSKLGETERKAYDAITEVMNRWYGDGGSDAQVSMALASAEAADGAGTLIPTDLLEALSEPAKVSDEMLAKFGFSRKEAEKYSKLIAEDNEKARSELSNRLTADAYKKSARAWDLRYKAKRVEALQRLNSHEGYSALSILQRAKNPDGTPIVLTTEKKPKMNHAEAVAAFGEDEVKRLNALGNKITTKNGYPLEGLAPHLNFQDMAHMVHALKGIMSVDDKAHAMATEATISEIGPMASEEQIRADIDDALNNDKRAFRLRYEIKHLASERTAAFMRLTEKVHIRVPSRETSRSRAEAYVSTLVADELNPRVFARIERQNSKLSREAYRKGDLQEAANYKLKELAAYENYRAARAAKSRRGRAVSFFKDKQRVSSQKRLGKGGEGVQELFNLMASVMGSRKELSQDEMERVPSLTEMLVDLKSEAAAPLDAVLLLNPLLDSAEAAPDMTVAQSEAAYLVGRFLSKVATLEANARAADKRESREERIEDMVSQLAETHKMDRGVGAGLSSDETADRKMLAGLREYAAAHLKMEFVFDGLDSNAGVTGSFHQTFMAPLLRAQEAAGKLHKQSHEALAEAFSTYSKTERRALGRKRHFVASMNRSISKWDALMVALNWGNQGNREALLGGQRGLTLENVSEMMSILDARDADLVQGILDEIDSHWDAASQVNRRQTGITPGKVQATAFQLGGKEIQGGYFPISIDRKHDAKSTDESAAAEALDDLAKDSPAMAMTAHGHLKARKGTGGRPLNLNPSVISNHLSSVIHDITHRETVLDLWFVTKNPTFASAVTAAAGKETYDLFAPWLMSVARADTTEAANVFDKTANWMRNRVTGALLAFNHGTMLSQITGMTLSLRELGPVSMLKGMKAAFANSYNPIEGYRAATAKSSFMRDRIEQGYERETAAMLKQHRDVITSVPGMTSEIANVGLQAIGVAQMLVDLPTWWGAYIKAMDGDAKGIAAGDEGMAIEHADHLVRITQGESGALSASKVQRFKGIMKWMVMFYTFFGTQINLIGREIGKVRRDGLSAVPDAFLGLSMIIMTQVMEDAIRGRYTYDEDDEEDEHYRQVLRKAGITAAMTPFTGMIGIRDVASMISQRGQYGRVFNMNPVFGAVKSTVEGGYSLAEWATEDGKELSKKAARDIAIGVGTATGMPGLEAFKIGELLISEE